MYFSGDLPGVMENGFFYGYTNLVVAVILLQVIYFYFFTRLEKFWWDIRFSNEGLSHINVLD